MRDDLSLSIRGVSYAGWQNVKVTTSIEQMARTFAVDYTERATDNGEPVPIFEGDAVIVKLGDDIVLEGYVDESNRSYDANNITASINGRSKAGDLVDCAAIHKGGSWKGVGLERIAKDLLAPFGMNAAVTDTAANYAVFRRFSIQDGETVFETLDRAARMRGVLMLSKPDGDLEFRRVGIRHTKTPIEFGVNVLSGEYKGSTKDRFSQYTVKAQAVGDNQFYGEQSAGLKKTITDARIDRYRPTIISAENEDSGRELEARARWEMNVRTGRGRRVTYKVQGWRDNAGKLWEVNTRAQVKDTRFQLSAELLIVSATFEKSVQGGSTTTLELTDQHAFDVQPLPPPKPKGRGIIDLRPGEQ